MTQLTSEIRLKKENLERVIEDEVKKFWEEVGYCDISIDLECKKILKGGGVVECVIPKVEVIVKV